MLRSCCFFPKTSSAADVLIFLGLSFLDNFFLSCEAGGGGVRKDHLDLAEFSGEEEDVWEESEVEEDAVELSSCLRGVVAVRGLCTLVVKGAGGSDGRAEQGVILPAGVRAFLAGNSQVDRKYRLILM